ncbi:MAG: phosphoadenylyl-sulfate reductase [Rhodobacteraceae bacterium]|nr:phosphoadenylyl-sulfate reductase [Paracoccaceae bacterium]
MPFETASLSLPERVKMLNHIYHHQAAVPVLRNALQEPMIGRVVLVSSFGAESVVLLHMLSTIDKATPVLFIDTQMLFPQTLEYQQSVSEKLGLTNVKTLRAAKGAVAATDPYGRLHMANPDACCALRKTEPLEQALAPFDAWITGRKRFQAGTRTELELFETDGDARMKINPLARWRKEDVRDYIENNNLPRHPLVAKGFPSIGCAPCTSAVKPGEDERSGRWRGADKVECGIHFGANGAEQAA